MRKIPNTILTRLLWPLLLLSTAVQAGDDNWDDELEEHTRSVNEGELHFLAEPPTRPVHHHLNQMLITEDSLRHGWVALKQCHDHLDPVPASQIVYHPERIRGLSILSASGIRDARVQGPSVQLQDVQPGARLCLQAESRALRRRADGCWTLRNGPYMRQFLDGYYPMGVTLEVSYPAQLLVHGLDPSARPGVQLQQSPGALTLSMHFEGRLYTEVVLCTGPD